VRNARRLPFLALPLAFLLAFAACDDEGGGNSISGTFEEHDVGGPVDARARIDQDFLDVIITAVVKDIDGDLTLVIVVRLPASDIEGRTVVVGTGAEVSANVHVDEEPDRPASGVVVFEAFDPEPGGTVAGSYDLRFAGGELKGRFDATVE
jgi:hypothetical protein